MNVDPLFILEAILSIIAIASAIIAIEIRELIAAVAMLGLVSLVVSIYFLILQAPDVAMTEASIGAGLSVAIFVYAFRRARETMESLKNIEEEDKGVLIR